MQKPGVNEVLETIGAVAEMQAFHFKELRKHGLRRKEAIELVKDDWETNFFFHAPLPGDGARDIYE